MGFRGVGSARDARRSGRGNYYAPCTCRRSYLTPDETAAAASEMEHFLEQHPQLSDFGFGLADFYKTHAERVAKFRADRESVRDPRSLAQFTIARGWLRQFAKLKSLNKRGTSYGLKHVAAHDIGYVTNGVLIPPPVKSPLKPSRLRAPPILHLQKDCGGNFEQSQRVLRRFDTRITGSPQHRSRSITLWRKVTSPALPYLRLALLGDRDRRTTHRRAAWRHHRCPPTAQRCFR